MLRKREDEELNARQRGTNEHSAVAMLPIEGERRLYQLYREFFRNGDVDRHWNLWEDLPWGEAPAGAPSESLVQCVMDQYRDLIFLPDYSAACLREMRSSRGRAWFITRWSYEEGKHLLTLHEWLMRRAGIPDAQLKAMSDAWLEEYRWVPPAADPEILLADALAWEHSEVARVTALRDRALADGETALVAACHKVLADDQAHTAFLEAALVVVAEWRPEAVQTAVDHVEEFAPEVAPRVAAVLR